MFKLLDKYQDRLNAILQVLFSNKDIEFKLSFHIYIYNREKTKMYRDMATNSYSKILPAIASGITQTEFLSLNYYEENILNIEELIPVQQVIRSF